MPQPIKHSFGLPLHPANHGTRKANKIATALQLHKDDQFPIADLSIEINHHAWQQIKPAMLSFLSSSPLYDSLPGPRPTTHHPCSLAILHCSPVIQLPSDWKYIHGSGTDKGKSQSRSRSRSRSQSQSQSQWRVFCDKIDRKRWKSKGRVGVWRQTTFIPSTHAQSKPQAEAEGWVWLLSGSPPFLT